MNNLETNILFNKLQSLSNSYKSLNIEYSEDFQNLFNMYNKDIDKLRSRVNMISVQTREEASKKNSKEIYLTIIELNTFSKNKYLQLKSDVLKIDDKLIRVTLESTIDELTLINESIRNKEFLKDKNTFFYIYEKITINGFLNFLVLKDMSINLGIIESFSQALLSQIQTLSLISI